MRFRSKGDISARMVLLACVATAILIAAPAAYGQADRQYDGLSAPGAPVLDQAGVIASGGSEGGTAGAQAGGGSTSDEAGEGDGGTIPFTGYPLTPLVAAIAMLMAAGLALRIAVPRLDRRHT